MLAAPARDARPPVAPAAAAGGHAGLLQDLVQAFCEFLEAAVHTALYARNLYAREVFERARLYNVFIRRSRHPQLNAYIATVVGKLKVRAGRPVNGPPGPSRLSSGGGGFSGRRKHGDHAACVAAGWAVIVSAAVTHATHTAGSDRVREPEGGGRGVLRAARQAHRARHVRHAGAEQPLVQCAASLSTSTLPDCSVASSAHGWHPFELCGAPLPRRGQPASPRRGPPPRDACHDWLFPNPCLGAP